MLLHDLYVGDLCPSEQIALRGKKYDEMREKACELMIYFERNLDKEEYDKVKELVDNVAGSQSMECEDNFQYGFSLGIRLLAEAIYLPQDTEE